MDDPWGMGCERVWAGPANTGLHIPVRAHAIGHVHTGPGQEGSPLDIPMGWDSGRGRDITSCPSYRPRACGRLYTHAHA